MNLVELFCTKTMDGTVYSCVVVDLNTNKFYSALSFEVHGYGGAYGSSYQIGSQLSTEEVRYYASKAYDNKEDYLPRLEPYLNMSDEEFSEISKRLTTCDANHSAK